MYSYDGLKKELARREMTMTALGKAAGISSRTLAKISKGQKISSAVLRKMSIVLSCPVETLCREVSDNPVLRALREEREHHISNGFYHELQVRMTYNSNHMEGSRLTEKETRMIFETSTIDGNGSLFVDDILETVHHFRAIDYVIDHAEEKLTETMIKELHLILKQDTRDARLPWFAVGDYKKRPNMVGGRETAAPEDVHKEMMRLLSDYRKIQKITLEDIITFHVRFERIHPFQDGNGRVGRLIALKECLGNTIVPFLIEDRKKDYYYRGLYEWDREPGYLLDTCRDGQDTVRKLLDYFQIETAESR